MSGAAALELRAVTRRYPGIVANDAVSFALHADEVHVLAGENGAGKSTLVAMLAGLQVPDEGEIRVAGEPVRLASPREALARGIGTVFQHARLVPSLTVADNLLLGAAWWRRPARAALAARLAETCAAVGVALDPGRRVRELSLGERQLVEVVRALWRGGRVLVLDEPTARLTPQGSAELIALLRRVAARGVAVVFITHKLDEAFAAADRITVLRRGRAVDRIDAEALCETPRAALERRLVVAMFGAAPDVVRPEAAACVGGDAVLEAPGFTVGAGEVFGIAGADGNGQTALAEALAGQSHADLPVRLDGRSLAGLGVAARSRAGLRYVTDDRLGEGTVGSLPLALNLLLKRIGERPFWRFGVARPARIAAHAQAVVAAFDVRAQSVAQPVSTLSGGNVQKLLLARELEGAPRAVIYNKPTAGLDMRAAQAAWQRIRAMAARGVAGVLISADLDELLALCDRIGVMRQGRFVAVVGNGPEARAQIGRALAGLRDDG